MELHGLNSRRHQRVAANISRRALLTLATIL
jgi:hypothetical protein